jgi:hypothetical protein
MLKFGGRTEPSAMHRISTRRAIAYELADAFAERCRAASKNPESMITV